MTLEEAIRASLLERVNAGRVSIKRPAAEVAALAAEHAADLARLVGRPEFDPAVRASVDSLALYAGLLAVREADAADAETRAFFGDVVRIAAAALASA